MYIEFLGKVDPYIGLVLKIFAAILAGAFVGAEREKKLKYAGIKTHVLIAFGTTLFASLPTIGLGADDLTGQFRLSAQIIGGVGFLGAGSILQIKNEVYGLTSAAGIWVMAAIGLFAGWGYIFSTLFLSFITILVLRFSDHFYKFYTGEDDFFLEIIGQGQEAFDLEPYLKSTFYQIYSKEFYRDEVKNKFILIYQLKIDHKSLTKITNQLKELDYIRKVDVRFLKNIPKKS